MFSPAKALGGLLDHIRYVQGKTEAERAPDLLGDYGITDLMLTCALFALFLSLLIFLCVRPFKRLYAQVPGGKLYRYPAVNTVSVCIGLLPALYILAEGIRAQKLHGIQGAWFFYYLAFVLAMGLGAGMYVGDIHNALPPENPPQRPKEHATWIIAGAAGGFMLFYFSLLIFNILVLIALLMCSEPLISGVIAACTVVSMVHAILKRKQQPVKSANAEKMNLEREMAVILANVKKTAAANNPPAPQSGNAAPVEPLSPPPQSPAPENKPSGNQS